MSHNKMPASAMDPKPVGYTPLSPTPARDPFAGNQKAIDAIRQPNPCAAAHMSGCAVPANPTPAQARLMQEQAGWRNGSPPGSRLAEAGPAPAHYAAWPAKKN
jgi:hypothetical protein